MKQVITLAAAAMVTLAASSAQAAYRCELFDRAENAPGGDVPVLVKFTDSNDFDAAKKACSGLVDKKNIVGYWLKWIEAKDLPTEWKAADLLASGDSSQTQTPVQPTAPEKISGVACIIYDSPSDKPMTTFYGPDSIIKRDELTLEDITGICKSLMRALLPNQYRDFEVRYVDELPQDWFDRSLFGEGC
jgi:hypothetical protein